MMALHFFPEKIQLKSTSKSLICKQNITELRALILIVFNIAILYAHEICSFKEVL